MNFWNEIEMCGDCKIKPIAHSASTNFMAKNKLNQLVEDIQSQINGHQTNHVDSNALSHTVVRSTFLVLNSEKKKTNKNKVSDHYYQVRHCVQLHFEHYVHRNWFKKKKTNVRRSHSLIWIRVTKLQSEKSN